MPCSILAASLFPNRSKAFAVSNSAPCLKASFPCSSVTFLIFSAKVIASSAVMSHSLAGGTAILLKLSIDLCVSGSKVLIDSNSSSKKESLIPCTSEIESATEIPISIKSPRIAYWPADSI